MSAPLQYTTQDGVLLTRHTFISKYVAAFAAAWTVKHYEDYCAREMHGALERPPIEDILSLADKQWEYLTTVVQP